MVLISCMVFLLFYADAVHIVITSTVVAGIFSWCLPAKVYDNLSRLVPEGRSLFCFIQSHNIQQQYRTVGRINAFHEHAFKNVKTGL